MICRVVALKGLLILAAAAILTSSCMPPCLAQADPEPDLAPVNAAFADYSADTHRAQAYPAGSCPAGLVPEPFELPNVRTVRSLAITLPAAYDLRPLGKLTAVRDQGACGTCWDFAAMGSLESSLLPGEICDFSENNLKNLSGFDVGCCAGGNRAMATAYLASWAGPVAETDDRYNTSNCSSAAGLPVRKHVQDVIFVPNRTGALDNASIKQAIMTYGAVYTTYYHSSSFYKSSTAAYYCGAAYGQNHAVCIVGWDDSFPAANFITAPPGNGAFLMRNSWGAYWGVNGYFWMSYYDSALGKTENAVFLAETTTNYDQVYQYDRLGWVSSTGYGTNTAWFANIFTAASDCAVAAASWYAASPGASYTVSVYKDPTSSPVSSTSAQVTISGTLATAGYHTVQLPSTVQVSAGQKFSVVVKLTTPGYSYPVCLEMPYTGYSAAATASLGQSYISSSGSSWTDVASRYANSNVCLKAFAVNSDTAPAAPGVLSVTPSGDYSASGTVGGPFAPSSTTYTLTNTGQSAIEWSAAASQPWIGVSNAGGALAAGASASLTVSVNASGNTLAAGTYTGSVAFSNESGGAGNTNRGVFLAVNAPAGALSVTPGAGLNSSGKTGGPFSPTGITYTLTNTGTAALAWTAGVTKTWLTLSARSGSLAPGASVNVSAAINPSAAKLYAGTYTDTIRFTNTTNGVGTTTRAASLAVSAAAPAPAAAYRMQAATYSWINPSSYTRLVMSDDYVRGVSLPFRFTYYGKAYSALYVSSNGMVGFSSGGLNAYNNTNMPYAGTPNGIICPYWDDLNPAIAGTVRVALMGKAPARKMVVSWVGVALDYYRTTKLTFQVILCEGSNEIIFQYQNIGTGTYAGGAGATVGIENETGTQACKFSYNAGALKNGMAIRFTSQTALTEPNLFRKW